MSTILSGKIKTSQSEKIGTRHPIMTYTAERGRRDTFKTVENRRRQKGKSCEELPGSYY